jgi:hypothetical protein
MLGAVYFHNPITDAFNVVQIEQQFAKKNSQNLEHTQAVYLHNSIIMSLIKPHMMASMPSTPRAHVPGVALCCGHSALVFMSDINLFNIKLISLMSHEQQIVNRLPPPPWQRLRRLPQPR